MEAVLRWIGCLIENLLDSGFGDPSSANGDDAPTDANFQAICTAGRPCILYLYVSGAAEVEFTSNKTSKIGARLPAGKAVVLDRFKGTLYARSVSGASVLNWHIFPRNTTD